MTVSDDRLLTLTQVARALGTGEPFVRKLLREQQLRCVHLGRLVRVPASELHRYVEHACNPKPDRAR